MYYAFQSLTSTTETLVFFFFFIVIKLQVINLTHAPTHTTYTRTLSPTFTHARTHARVSYVLFNT